MRRPILPCLLFAALAIASLPVGAQVRATEAWVRGMVPGQDTTGVYMRLEAQSEATLVGVASPIAKRVELHEMTTERGVMKMRPVTQLRLPAGKAVELGPGGYHIMLVNVAHTLREGETVPIELELQDGAGKRSRLVVQATVKPLTTSAPAAPHGH